jgi:hypothetical protein
MALGLGPAGPMVIRGAIFREFPRFFTGISTRAISREYTREYSKI